MKNYVLFSYQVLSSIYKDGAYLSIALSDTLPYLDSRDRALVTNSVYGVLEHHEEFSYFIKKLCNKSPRPAVRICLRLGMYYIKYMNSIPSYAAVNEIVSLTKTVKKEQAGFVNATLKAFITQMNDLPTGKLGRSIEFNVPTWLLDEYVAEYGKSEAERLLSLKRKHTHLRINKNRYSEKEFEKYCSDRGLEYTKTEYGYLVKATSDFSLLFKQGKLTLMALDSIKICKTLVGDKPSSAVLDLCSAPGGKSVYIAEQNPSVTVYAVDLHAHRAELVESYAKRMGVTNIETIVADSTVFNPEWKEKFSYVLVDAPCSGVGVLAGNPDIILNRTKEDLTKITDIQSKLVETASRYLKKGGIMTYSTCSNLKVENEKIVETFLAKHPDFELSPSEILENKGFRTFENDEYGNDGFFVSRIRRKE